MANKIFRSRYEMQRIENLIEHGAPIVDPTSKHWLRWDIDADDWSDTGSTADAAAAATEAQAAQAAAEAAQRNAEQALADATEQATQAGQSATAAAASAADAAESVADIYKAFPTESASGAIASTAVGADGIPLKSLSVQIEPAQSGSGDPSPTNVRLISGWTEADIRANGKNLFDLQTIGGSKVSINVEDGIVHVSTDNNTNAATNQSGGGIMLKAGVTYTASCRIDNAVRFSNDYPRLTFRTVTGNAVRAWSALAADADAGKISVSYTPEKNTKIYVSLMLTGSTAETASADISNIQLEIGASSTEYEPYIGDYVPVSWQTEAGTVYGGTLAYNRDGTWTLTVTHNITTISALSWETVTAPHVFKSSNITTPSGGINVDPTVPIVCDSYVSVANTVTSSEMDNLTIKRGALSVDTRRRIYVRDDEFEDPVAFANARASVTVAFPVRTRTSVILTADGVKSLLGDCNVWADCGDVDAVFRCDPTLYIDSKISSSIVDAIEGAY